MIEFFKRFFDIPLTTVVPDLKVNTYMREYTDTADIFIDQDAHVFRIDFVNNGSNTCDISTPGDTDGSGPHILLSGKSLPFTFENHPAYGRKDAYTVSFNGAGTNSLTVITHHLE